ncbi:hypothetical protein [Quadrisphaera setariae]|uniref:SNARE associated Golgi protein n=1 Tax=Quadrisphaera setariae TaxID=2593304 RepID=A0A5C8Z611_9ACTN|nr:hypothetical protein [Quadrisphaera setariae]TXR52719.1 hypothetical protein FMM08_18390 [Quadrisphaera setariae]
MIWRRFVDGRGAPALTFAWAAGEATVWWVPADYLLAALVLGHRRRWPSLLGACVGGMAAGGLVSLTAARARPDAALAVVRGVPGVTPARLDRVRSLLGRHGTAALLLQPVSGIPFKAWAAVLGPTDVPLVVSAPALLSARAARMAGTALLAQLVARSAQRAVERWQAR